jgi:glutamate-1-semialdehyde 2,1-aminomutase
VATGRTHILACGYFGWLDWCSDAAGVPDAVQASVSTIAYGDIASLDEAVAVHGSTIAAVIVEPFIHDFAPREWLLALRDRCDRLGAVLVFDEIKTAFRFRTGGVQELLGLMPDLTTVGKALANGYPLAAVVGRAAIMEAATHTWISSTAAAESTGLAAAMAVLDWHDRIDVPAELIRTGRALHQAMRSALQDAQFPAVRVEGPPQMFRLVANDDAQLDAFVAAVAMHGVLLKRGAYQFAALAHTGDAVAAVHAAVRAACRDLEESGS